MSRIISILIQLYFLERNISLSSFCRKVCLSVSVVCHEYYERWWTQEMMMIIIVDLLSPFVKILLFLLKTAAPPHLSYIFSSSAAVSNNNLVHHDEHHDNHHHNHFETSLFNSDYDWRSTEGWDEGIAFDWRILFLFQRFRWWEERWKKRRTEMMIMMRGKGGWGGWSPSDDNRTSLVCSIFCGSSSSHFLFGMMSHSDFQLLDFVLPLNI